MAELVRVVFKDGSKSTVGRAWLKRWPEDIKTVLDEDFAPVGEEQAAVLVASVSPTGDKKKEK